MYSIPDFRTVKTGNILLNNDWNLHPFLPLQPSGHLRCSIATMGLLHPPIVKEMNKKNKDRNYQLLCGQRRFMAFQNAFPEKTEVTALVLPKDYTAEDILTYLLSDKMETGGLSPMGKAHFFKYCLKYMSAEAAAQKFHPLLAEKTTPHTITQLTTLSELEPELQISIHNGQLSPKLGHELLSLSTNDRMTLHNLFQRLEFGGGKQKRLLTLCKDLAFRHEKTITALVAEEKFQDILDHPKMNLPQKGASLLTALHKQLFPQSNEAEENFNKRVKWMELPASCTIQHSPAFERDDILLTINFPSIEKLEKQVNKLKELT